MALDSLKDVPLAEWSAAGIRVRIFLWIFGATVVAVAIRTAWDISSTASARKQLADLIRTQPPRTFFDQFRGSHQGAVEAVDGYTTLLQEDDVTNDMVEQGARETICYLLAQVARLSDLYNHRQGGARYSANLMVLEDYDEAKHREILKFCEHEENGRLAGVLVLAEGMSATTAGEPDFRPIALPFPTRIKSKTGAHLVLPGAPYALAHADISWVTDVLEMADWCKEFGDFRKEVVEELRAYMKEASSSGRYGAMVSIPLLIEGEIIILNLQSSHTGYFEEEKQRAAFLSLMEPFFSKIGQVWTARRDWMSAASG
jgi:hypothetical protein